MKMNRVETRRRSDAFVEVLCRESWRSRVSRRMEKRSPNVQLAGLFGATGSDDRSDRWTRLTRRLACAASGMIDGQARRFDLSGLEHALERAVTRC